MICAPPQQRAREDKAAHIGTTKWLLDRSGNCRSGVWRLVGQRTLGGPKPLATVGSACTAGNTCRTCCLRGAPAPSLATAESAHIPAKPAQPLHPLAPAAQALAADDAPSLDRMARGVAGSACIAIFGDAGLGTPRGGDPSITCPRGHAAPRLWPLSPVGGKLQTQPSAQGLQIAAANSARYDAVVAFVTGLILPPWCSGTGRPIRCCSRPMRSWATRPVLQ